jgi:hypothetical protein
MRSADIPLKRFAKIMTFGKGKDFCPLSKLISTGNLKLPKTTAIFNMGPATSCVSLALGLCRAYAPDGRHVCYAMKAEGPRTPGVLPYRIEQLKFWKKTTPEEFVWQFLCINALKELPWTKLRLNESGDFHKQECVQKADKIAMLLARFKIKVYCYTHRSDLDYTGVKHLVINGSNFQKEGIPNIFMMVEDTKDKPLGWSICPEDCRICDRCSKRGQSIVIKRH